MWKWEKKANGQLIHSGGWWNSLNTTLSKQENIVYLEDRKQRRYKCDYGRCSIGQDKMEILHGKITIKVLAWAGLNVRMWQGSKRQDSGKVKTDQADSEDHHCSGSLLGYREAGEERTWTMREHERGWVARVVAFAWGCLWERREKREVRGREAVLVYLATLGPGSDLVRRSDTTGQPEPTWPALHMRRGHCASSCAVGGPQADEPAPSTAWRATRIRGGGGEWWWWPKLNQRECNTHGGTGNTTNAVSKQNRQYHSKLFYRKTERLVKGGRGRFHVSDHEA